MVTEGTDLITTAKPEKKSLLEKYDISVEQLSYEFITECTNGKTMERIVTILRSGEEGIYPDLTRHAEERLVALKPNSMVLRKTVPVLMRNMLEPDERKELDDDINDWTREMHCREKDLDEGKVTIAEDPFLLPDVRHVDEVSTMKKDSDRKGNSDRKSKRIGSCDYAAWDKYDVDTEINRIDLQEEREQVEAKEIQRKLRDTVERRKAAAKIVLNKPALTSTEIDVMAERERKKGNEAFRIGDYVDALRFYDSSIAINSCPTAYNNRAMTLIKLQRYEDALEDCNIVLRTDEGNVKALLRRALCFERMEKRHEALADYETVLRLEPANGLAIAGVKKLRKPCESRKVRMKIEETTAEENGKSTDQKTKINTLSKCIPKSSLVEVKARTVENSICVCEKGPGPSHSDKPLPHMKGTYCVRNESKKTLPSCSDINRTLTNMSLLSSTKGNTRSRDESLGLTRKETVPRISKEKSIFSCKTKNDTSVSSSGVVIEEIPSESPTKDAKSSAKSKTKKNDDRANDEVKHNRNTVDRRKFNSSPPKIEVASKYSQPCRKENNFTNLNITSPYEFLRAWQSLKDDNDLQLHARLLRALESEDLNTGNKLDGAMFSLILRCLERHFRTSQDRELLVRYLKSLSQLSRFSIVKMFMDNNDKKALTNVFQFLEDQGSTEVSILREIYV